MLGIWSLSYFNYLKYLLIKYYSLYSYVGLFHFCWFTVVKETFLHHPNSASPVNSILSYSNLFIINMKTPNPASIFLFQISSHDELISVLWLQLDGKKYECRKPTQSPLSPPYEESLKLLTKPGATFVQSPSKSDT